MGKFDEYINGLPNPNKPNLSDPGTNPDSLAGDLELSAAFALPPSVVALDRDNYRAQFDKRKAEAELTDAPKTSAWLSRDKSNASLARDDIQNLTWFEKNTGPVGALLAVVLGVPLPFLRMRSPCFERNRPLM